MAALLSRPSLTEVEVLVPVCEALEGFLTERTEHVVHLFTAQAHIVLLDSLRALKSSAHASAAIFRALGTMMSCVESVSRSVFTPKFPGRLVTAGFAALDLHQGDAAVCEAAARALLFLNRVDSEAIRKASTATAPRIVANALVRHSGEARACTELLYLLLPFSRTDVPKELALPVAAAASASLVRSGADTYAAEAASSVLCWFACFAPRRKDVVHDSGGIEALVAATHHHHANPGVAYALAKCFNAVTNVEEYATRCIAAGVDTAMLLLLSSQMDLDGGDIAFNLCAGLMQLAKDAACAERMAADGAVGLCTTVITRHALGVGRRASTEYERQVDRGTALIPTVQAAGSALHTLYGLCVTRRGRADCCDPATVAAIVGALRLHQADDVMLSHSGFYVLSHLACSPESDPPEESLLDLVHACSANAADRSHGADTAALFARFGVVPLALAALERHTKSSAIVNQAVQCLARLPRSRDGARTFVAGGVVQALAACLKRHSKSEPQVVAGVCYAFRNFVAHFVLVEGDAGGIGCTETQLLAALNAALEAAARHGTAGNSIAAHAFCSLLPYAVDRSRRLPEAVAARASPLPPSSIHSHERTLLLLAQRHLGGS